MDSKMKQNSKLKRKRILNTSASETNETLRQAMIAINAITKRPLFVPINEKQAVLPCRKEPPPSPLYKEGNNPYVYRQEIWAALKMAGLSVNAAARILGKGKQFRKWANASGNPKDLTRITFDEIARLKGIDWTRTKRPILIIS